MEAVKRLCAAGDDKDVQDQAGFAPFGVTSHEGHAGVVKLLYDAGAAQDQATDIGVKGGATHCPAPRARDVVLAPPTPRPLQTAREVVAVQFNRYYRGEEHALRECRHELEDTGFAWMLPTVKRSSCHQVTTISRCRFGGVMRPQQASVSSSQRALECGLPTLARWVRWRVGPLTLARSAWQCTNETC